MRIKIIILAIILILGVFKIQAQHNNQLNFGGFVFGNDANKKRPLYAANIIAHAKDSTILGSINSDIYGYFLMKLDSKPNHIIISYVGYETYTINEFINIKDNLINLDTCYLTPNNTFKEVIVSGATTKYKLSGEEYLITNKKRSIAANSLDLLDQIPGIRYNKMSNEVKIIGKSNILYLVNNLEQSKDYILNLTPDRISKILIDKSPRGRYQSEGYDAIINIILKNDYLGYDLNLQNFAITNLEKNNGRDWLMTDQPSINFVYTNNKVNAFANYTYGLSKWNMEVEKHVKYNDLLTMDSHRATKNDLNDIYRYQGNVVNSGINYKLNSKHIISLQGDYTYSKIHTDNYLNFKLKDIPQNKEYSLSNITSNKNNSDNYSLTLFYSGKINNKMKIYSDLSYNHFSNKVYNSLSQNGNTLSENDFKEKRNLIKLNSNLEYLFLDKFVFNFGYTHNFRKYKSILLDNTNTLDYIELRHRIFTHAQYKLNEKIQIEFGTGLEYIKADNNINKKHFWELLPYAIMNYNITPNFNTKFSYLTDMEYPSLYQLNSSKTPIDAYLTQTGNPNLQTSVNHNLSIDFNLWNKITLTPSYTYTPRQIEEFIENNNNRFISTFKNTDMKHYALQLIYEQPLGKYFSISNSINYYRDKIKYQNHKYSINGILFDSELSYSNPKYALMMQLGYYRSMQKNIKIQGYQMYNFDSWAFTANKKLFKNKLNVMLSYFLPLEWGVRNTQNKVVNSPYYNENYNVNLKNYRNTLILRVSYRFNSGKARFSNKKNSINNEERINRTFDF